MEPFFLKILRVLKIIYAPILKTAHFIGKINTFILLTIFYWVFLAFAKLSLWVVGKNSLDMKCKDRQSYWKKRDNFTIDRQSLLEPY